MSRKHNLLQNTFVVFFLMIPFALFSQVATVSSPDQRLLVKFDLHDSVPVYQVYYKNKQLLRPSQLGFLLNSQTIATAKYHLDGNITSQTISETWKPLYGQFSEIKNQANQLQIHLVQNNRPFYRFSIIIRVYNEGFAFRYYFPEQPNLKQFTITDELTEFNFAKDYTAWWMKDDGGIYEQLFQRTPLSKVKNIFTPITLTDGDSLFMAVHQAALIDYAGMSLVRSAKDSLRLKCDLAPWPDGAKVKTWAPRYTPWRYVLIANQLSDLVESQMILNLNDSCTYKEVSWIKPQKFTGIFWAMHTRQWTWADGPLHGATTAHAKSYIEFAAAHHIDALLMEGWNRGWETWAVGDSSVQDFTQAYPDLNLAEVVAYGKQKGVEIIGHHETGGNIPLYENQMSAAFKYYSSLGIHSVKTGYSGTMIPRGMNRHGQQMVNHYQSVVDTAAKYRIMIDSHEPIIPTGLSRTYPNWMTGEAVRGMEWCNFDPWPPSHLTTLPYTRSLAGPFDFTIGIFKLKYDTLRPWLRVNTTLANQLALYVIFYSPMQMIADLPENMEHNKAFPFAETVPVSWDETRLLQGSIGEFSVMARRKHQQWWLGAITNEQNRDLHIPLNFLSAKQRYVAEIYADTLGTDWYNKPETIAVAKYSVDAADTLHAALAKGGGLAVRFVPVDKSKTKNLPGMGVFNQLQATNSNAFAQGTLYGFKTKVSHLAVGAKVTYQAPYSPDYAAGGDSTLTDGILGTQNCRDGNWQGIQGKDEVATLDLGKLKAVSSISLRFLQYTKDWIFIPKQVTLYISADGKTYTQVATETFETIAKDERALIHEFVVNLAETLVRYIKMEATNAGPLPAWHPAAGNPSWMFCDEVVVK
ncbi:MAG: glycoside hydrolase family 97 catalytic domain-containing protein [Bacteroidota bacterium]